MFKRLKPATTIVSIAMLGTGLLASTATVFAAPTPIAAYSFDEGAGTTLSDRSGHGHTGQLSGGPVWATGKHGAGLAFDGVNAYVGMGDVVEVNGLHAITVSAWVKFSAAGGGSNEVHFVDKSGCNGYPDSGPWELGVALTQAHKAEFVVYPQGGSPYTYVFSGASSTSIDDGNWHYIVGRYDGNYLSIWVDGVEENSSFLPGLTMNVSTYGLEMAGHCSYGTPYPFAGTIDDVRIYDSALSAAEIQTDMATGVSGGAPPPPTAPSLNFSVSPSTIANGSSATLAWSSTDATSCNASGAWSGAKALSGSETTGSLLVTATYSLTCSGPGGSTTQSATVTVNPPAPTVNLTASPPTVISGNTSTLSWSSTNATTCAASGAWSGAKGLSGSQTTAALTQDSTFTLTCTGAGGSGNKSVTVTVTAPPPVPTVSLSASPTTVVSGNTSTLSWSSTNATSCTASGAWSGSRNLSGTQTTAALTQNSTFTLTCSGAGGSASQSATVTVTAPPPVPTVSLSASPNTVVSGNTSTLSWSSTNATSCAASDAWSGSKNLSGTQTTAALTQNSTFTLTCSGAGGSASQSATVTVTAPPPVPTVSLSASPTTVVSGNSSTLSWSSTNATSCAASDAWSGNKSLSGTQTTAPLTQTSTFTLTCSGAGGSASQSVTVNVTAPPPTPTVSLSASPTSVISGTSSTLSWSSTNATSCVASDAWSGNKAPNGSEDSGALTQNSTFTLTCTGPGGSASQSVTVTVTAPPPPPPQLPTVQLTASPSSVVSGSSATLTWISYNANSCVASGAWSGSKGLTGTEDTGALTQSSTYTLTCSGAGGSASQSFTITVTPEVPPPPPPSANTNLALGKPITATSNDCDTECLAQFANDGDMSTRNSCDRNQYTCIVVVDLQGFYALREVKIYWEAACGRRYTIDASDDGFVWRTLATVTDNEVLYNDLQVNGSGRYVRMNGIERCLGYGYSMWEFEVYGGTQAPPEPDTSPPTVPGGLHAISVRPTQVTLAWQPSTDNIGVIGYRVYRNGALVGSTESTSFADIGLAASTTYNYAVLAYDAAGNQSDMSDVLGVTTLDAGSAASYATNFTLNENPISEGGKWVSGKADGEDWNNPRTNSGKAYASVLSGLGSTRYDDNITHLSPSFQTFSPDQFAEATVFLAPNYSANHEVELLLRFSISPGDAHGYEILWGLPGYLAVVRWNGPLGDYSIIYDPGIGSIPVPRNGDVLRAEISGNLVTIKLNGNVVAVVDVSAADGSNWTSGQPGFGFWPVDDAIPQNFGWKSYAAGDL